MGDNLRWVSGAGGPLVCSTPEAAMYWRGATESSVRGAQTDYDRACELEGTVGVLTCAGVHVLVLGDEPLRACLMETPDGTSIVRWVSALSTASAAAALATMPLALPLVEHPIAFDLDGWGLTIFAAAVDGLDGSASAIIDLEPGRYIVTSEKYKHEGRYEFLIHRLIRSEGT